MHGIPVLFSLIAAASASSALHYSVPSSFKALSSNCTLPANFVVANFTTYTAKDNSSSTVTFQFSDPGTKIQTTCQRNSTSKGSGPSRNRYGCSNVNIAFVYQTTKDADLTIAERACSSGTTTPFEAAGFVTPDLDCTDTSTGTLCRAKQTSLQGNFESFEPVPPEAPTRRDQRTWRG
ncbi:hypothetical protein GGS24DRAFT_471500 [Hypoxylon argillaceum]|nr:hypothetical protein GGS24DRAFT_471500 [Hypoxylon argillaceum]